MAGELTFLFLPLFEELKIQKTFKKNNIFFVCRLDVRIIDEHICT